MNVILTSLYVNNKPKKVPVEQVLKELPSGWHETIITGFSKMYDAGWTGEILQIKEKFGMLRIYLREYTDVIDGIVSDMEEKTGEICCVCGEPSTKISSGWQMFYCDEHFPNK